MTPFARSQPHDANEHVAALASASRPVACVELLDRLGKAVVLLVENTSAPKQR